MMSDSFPVYDPLGDKYVWGIDYGGCESQGTFVNFTVLHIFSECQNAPFHLLYQRSNVKSCDQLFCEMPLVPIRLSATVDVPGQQRHTPW